MLVKMRIKNFKSFKEETIIDLTTSKYGFLQGTNVNNDVLKGMIFVGSNASGKTNILDAIKKILELLFSNMEFNLDMDKCLFSQDETILLEYEFKIESSSIIYYIEYDISKRMLIEKLYVDNVELLNRIGDKGESYITDNKCFDELDETTLFIREIFFNIKFRGHDILKAWFDFLMNSIYVNAYLNNIFIANKTNLGLIDYLELNGTDKINQFFSSQNFEQQIEYSNESKGDLVLKKTEEENEIFFKRNNIGEPIPFHFESLGNKNLLKLLPVFFHAIDNSCMLLIDEFSSGFHNSLEELLVKYFMQESSSSQLFLVTHSTNLLSNSLLRPDQEIVVRFGENGSKISRISEEKPRQAQNIEKMYLGGVFGGIPNYYKEETLNGN